MHVEPVSSIAVSVCAEGEVAFRFLSDTLSLSLSRLTVAPFAANLNFICVPLDARDGPASASIGQGRDLSLC